MKQTQVVQHKWTWMHMDEWIPEKIQSPMAIHGGWKIFKKKKIFF